MVDVFVPNDTRIAGGAGSGAPFLDEDGKAVNSILLCTGANACGKVTINPSLPTRDSSLLQSVFLKQVCKHSQVMNLLKLLQVALIQIMAQVGDFNNTCQVLSSFRQIGW